MEYKKPEIVELAEAICRGSRCQDWSNAGQCEHPSAQADSGGL